MHVLHEHHVLKTLPFCIFLSALQYNSSVACICPVFSLCLENVTFVCLQLNSTVNFMHLHTCMYHIKCCIHNSYSIAVHVILWYKGSKVQPSAVWLI